MRTMLLLIALFLAPHTAQAQTDEGLVPGDPTSHQQVDSESGYQQLHDIPQQQPAAQAGAGKSTAPERWRYDSAARPGVAEKRPFQESPIERAVKGVNPCNVPYGGLLAEWRLAALRDTIENFNYWALLTLIVIVILESSGLIWLLRLLEERMQCTGGIVTQLWNAHIFARQKALGSIEAHNKAVAKMNAMCRAAKEQSASATTISPNGSEGSDASEPASAAVQKSASTSEKSEVLSGTFAPPTKDSPGECPQLVEDENGNDPAPLQVRAARFAQSYPQQPRAKVTRPEAVGVAAPTPEPPSESGNDAESSAADDVEALKLALQKAQAQLATKDAQLRAKDDKITSQRQLISDLDNRAGANGAARSGTN